MCKIEKVGFSCKIDKKFAQTDAVALTCMPEIQEQPKTLDPTNVLSQE